MSGAFWKDYERQSRAQRQVRLALQARCIDCREPIAPRKSRAGQTRTPLRCPSCAITRMQELTREQYERRRMRC